MAVDPLQGEIWETNFDPVRGHEQGGTRPALVLSQNWLNSSGIDLVIVASITTKPKGWADLEVAIKPPEGGLSDPSVVLCHQVRTISQNRLIMRRGQVRGSTLDEVYRIVFELISRQGATFS